MRPLLPVFDLVLDDRDAEDADAALNFIDTDPSRPSSAGAGLAPSDIDGTLPPPRGALMAIVDALLDGQDDGQDDGTGDGRAPAGNAVDVAVDSFDFGSRIEMGDAPPTAAFPRFADAVFSAARPDFFPPHLISPGPGDADAPAGFSADDFTGAGQTIIVIDDGYSNFYDQSSTVYEYDFSGVFNDPSARTAGRDSHGSWVAETALAEAEGADIIHLKVFEDGADSASLFDIEEALDFVIGISGSVDIAAVNLSLGYGNATDETLTMLSDEFAEIDALGIFSVVAAGNDGESYSDGVNVLAADPNVIGVSATNDDGAFADFSQTSATLTDIAADGEDVTVDPRIGSDISVSGTSFAAPTVSGIAARLQEASQEVNGERLDDDEFLQILRVSGAAVEGTGPDAPDGWRIADGDAAVEYFLANAELYDDDPLIG